MKDGGKLTIKSVAILIVTGIVAIEWLRGGTIFSRAFGLRVLDDILIFLLVAVVLSNWLK
jgi:hypothetical protein